MSAADERTSGSKDGSIVHADKPERAVRVTSEFESHFPHMMQLTQPRELEVERQCRYQVALGDLENAIKEPELEPWFERVTERGPKTFEAMCLLLPTADLEAILVRCEVPAGANAPSVTGS